MATDLVKEAKARGIEYFLISFTDLFGVMRAKLVPASAIKDMAKDGAGFGGAALRIFEEVKGLGHFFFPKPERPGGS